MGPIPKYFAGLFRYAPKTVQCKRLERYMNAHYSKMRPFSVQYQAFSNTALQNLTVKVKICEKGAIYIYPEKDFNWKGLYE